MLGIDYYIFQVLVRYGGVAYGREESDSVDVRDDREYVLWILCGKL